MIRMSSEGTSCSATPGNILKVNAQGTPPREDAKMCANPQRSAAKMVAQQHSKALDGEFQANSAYSRHKKTRQVPGFSSLVYLDSLFCFFNTDRASSFFFSSSLLVFILSRASFISFSRLNISQSRYFIWSSRLCGFGFIG